MTVPTGEGTLEDAAILVVDDDPGIVRLLQNALRADGFVDVESTTDPFEFLRRFDTRAPDLVILDLGMPGLSGHEVLDQLSARIPPGDFLPRIVLTGETDIEAKKRALSSGATEFLTKPVDMIEIALRVRNLLATRRLHLALTEEKRSLEKKVKTRTVELRLAHEKLVGSLRSQLEAQERRQRAEQELQHAVKVEALGQLAASVAHDFNNLLAVIMNFAEFAVGDLGEDHPVAADVREIRTAARSGTLLTRQLLMFSRKEDPRPEVLEPDVVIDEIRPLLETALKSRHRLEIRLAAPTTRVRIDRSHLEQILLNLAVNARDAMKDPGTVTVTTAWEAAGEEGTLASWSLCVSDTGVGMTDEVRYKIFDPFFTTKGKGQGTGLGLATVKRAIERAGGVIMVESTPGIGTTFRISLPAVDAELAPQLDPIGEERGRGESIVVVAEDDGLQRAMERTLRSNGYVPIVCGTGGEALAGPLSNGKRPALLITDVVAGDMTGAELASRSRVKTLFMSTYAEDVLQECEILDPDAPLLPKPFEPADLIAHVRRMFVHPS